MTLAHDTCSVCLASTSLVLSSLQLCLKYTLHCGFWMQPQALFLVRKRAKIRNLCTSKCAKIILDSLHVFQNLGSFGLSIPNESDSHQEIPYSLTIGSY